MTLADLIATDFATAQTDWEHTIEFQVPTVSTGNTGTETESLSAAVEVLGFWQPIPEEQKSEYAQRVGGIEGRPKWTVLVPLATSVSVGDVATHLDEVGEVMAVDSQPGHKELILKERK